MNPESRTRIARVLLAAACATAILITIPRLRAEWVYGQARGYGVSPAEDRPGRVEAYARAEALHDGEFAYPFRRGQILLARARTSRPADPELLDRAIAALERAARLAPLDPRVQAALAEAYLRRRNVDAALTAVERSVLLGPRHPNVLGRAADLYLRLWRGRRDVADLRRALEIAWAADRVGAAHPGAAAARLLARQGPRVIPDVWQATERDPELRTFVADALRAQAPSMAEALDGARDRP